MEMNEIKAICLEFKRGDSYDGLVRLEVESAYITNSEIETKPVLTMATYDLKNNSAPHWTGMDPEQILILVRSLLDIRSQMLDLPAYRT